MSTLFYGSPPGQTGGNYVGVLLTRLQLLGWDRVPVWNGPNYLHTRHRLRVRGIFNPEINAYGFTPFVPSAAAPSPNLAAMGVAAAGQLTRDAGVMVPLAAAGLPAGLTATSPGQQRGNLGPVTDLAVRHWLMQGQRQLIYAIGPTPVLVSPGLNADGSAATVDAWNGPTPLAVDVVEVSGTKTFRVDFAVESHVNEAQLYVGTPSVLLSHRWKARETIDQDYFSTRVITGHARFRTDRLVFLGAMPDDFRAALFHPLPGPGWKRNIASIDEQEDGASLDYTLVDRQLATSIIPAGVTRIECFMQAGASSFNAVEGVIDTAEGFLQKWIAGDKGGAWGQHLARMGFGLLGNLLPMTQLTVIARVWGRSDVFRKTLENVAVNILLTRFSVLNFVAKWAGATEVQLTHDVAGCFVEARCTKVTSLASAPWKGFVTAANIPDVGQYFPDDDETPGALTTNHGNVTPLGLPQRPNALGVGTRGTFITRLATAALLAPNAVPANPPPIMPAGAAVVDRSPP